MGLEDEGIQSLGRWDFCCSFRGVVALYSLYNLQHLYRAEKVSIDKDEFDV